MLYIEKSTNDMLTTFPVPVLGITGELTLHKLIQIIKHLMECSQKVETDISPLNYLFPVLESDLYTTHTVYPYLEVPTHTGHTSAYVDPSIERKGNHQTRMGVCPHETQQLSQHECDTKELFPKSH